MNLSKLKEKALNKKPKDTPKLELDKDECIALLNLVSEATIKVKNIQYVYELVYKIQEFASKE
jgi:hypothetical protein